MKIGWKHSRVDSIYIQNGSCNRLSFLYSIQCSEIGTNESSVNDITEYDVSQIMFAWFSFCFTKIRSYFMVSKYKLKLTFFSRAQPAHFNHFIAHRFVVYFSMLLIYCIQQLIAHRIVFSARHIFKGPMSNKIPNIRIHRRNRLNK